MDGKLLKLMYKFVLRGYPAGSREQADYDEWHEIIVWLEREIRNNQAGPLP